MLSFVFSVVTAVCSFVSMVALISISCNVRRLRDKFKASPGYDDPDDGYKVIPLNIPEEGRSKKSE